jgi:hypothetical protein
MEINLIKDVVLNNEDGFENVVSISFAEKIKAKAITEAIDDPLEDLLNEFSDAEDDIDTEEFIERRSMENIVFRDFSDMGNVHDVLAAISDMNMRKSYYLEEIETFSPKKNS